MSMVVAFANNQVLTAPAATSVTINTDPVSLNNYDRAFLTVNCHYIYGPAGTTPPTPTLTVTAEVSNDGTNWVAITAAAHTVTVTGTTTPPAGAWVVNGAFIRFIFSFAIDSGSDGGVCFDAHVNLDHV